MGKKVVIADDSATMRRIVTHVLEKRGWDVTAAADGVELLQAVFCEQPDLVVTDVNMPRLSGWIATRILKEDWSTADIPVLLLTSLGAASDRYWGGKAGSDRYLTKDFEPAELAAAVEDLVSQRPRAEYRPDPVQLSADDVLERTCEVLDRSLFHTSIAADITAVPSFTHGFEATVAALLDVLTTVVDHAVAGVVLAEERTAYLSVGKQISTSHITQFVGRAAEALELPPADLDVKVVDTLGQYGADEDAHLATFLSMPLRGYGGVPIGVLALSASIADYFGEAAMQTLRLIEGPTALVLDAARLTAQRQPA